MKKVSNENMLSVKEISNWLQVSNLTVYRWIKKGELPAYKIGHTWRFDFAKVNEWLELKKGKLKTNVEEPQGVNCE